MALNQLSGARNPNSSKGSQSQGAIRMNNKELRLTNILLTSENNFFCNRVGLCGEKECDDLVATSKEKLDDEETRKTEMFDDNLSQSLRAEVSGMGSLFPNTLLSNMSSK